MVGKLMSIGKTVENFRVWQWRRAMMRACLVAMFLLSASVAMMAPAASAAEPTRLMVIGDSLVAGYGLEKGKSFPAQLGTALVEAGHDVEVLGAGVSGDTTAAGLARLEWALADNPDAVIIVLGGNDMLRGLDPDSTKENLDRIVGRLKSGDVGVLLAGMLAPRNLGPDFVERFDLIYPKIAATHDIALYPFFLDGVATDPKLNLDDGLHPNEKGIAIIVERMLPQVEELLLRVEGDG